LERGCASGPVGRAEPEGGTVSKVTIHIDGIPVSLDIDKDGVVSFSGAVVGKLTKTANGRWLASGPAKVRDYRLRKDALLNMCFDSSAFWAAVVPGWGDR